MEKPHPETRISPRGEVSLFALNCAVNRAENSIAELAREERTIQAVRLSPDINITPRPDLLSFARMMEVNRLALEAEEQFHPQTFPFSPAQLWARMNTERQRLSDLITAEVWDPEAIRDAAAGVAMYAQLISRRVDP